MVVKLLNIFLLLSLFLGGMPGYTQVESCEVSCECHHNTKGKSSQASCHSKMKCEPIPFKGCCIKKASKDAPAVLANVHQTLQIDYLYKLESPLKLTVDYDFICVVPNKLSIKSPPIHILKSSFLL